MAGTGNGIVVGIVSNLDDQEGLGRVKVTYPHLENQESDWARLATPMAGAGQGLFLKPDIGHEVLVVFEHGDPRRPYILGSLWSKEDPPPPNDGKPTENNWRFLHSRSGHIILVDDTPGSERIKLIDKDGKRQVVIDSANGKIEVSSEGGVVDVVATGGTVNLTADTINVKAKGNMTLEAGRTMTLVGKKIDIN